MAIGNIQYVYDNIRFYSSAFRPEKNNKQRQQKKIQLKLARKRCRSLTAIFCPQNMSNRAFRKRQNAA